MTLSRPLNPPSAKRLIAASLLLLGTAFSTSALADEAWQQTVVDVVGVENYFREHCMMLEAGQTISYRYQSIYPVDFNIHHHPDNNIIFLYNEENRTRSNGNFRAEFKDHFCFTWTNKVERGGEEWSVVLDYQVTDQ